MGTIPLLIVYEHISVVLMGVAYRFVKAIAHSWNMKKFPSCPSYLRPRSSLGTVTYDTSQFPPFSKNN